MNNILSNRYAQVGAIAIIAAAIFMVFQSSDADDTIVEATATTTAAPEATAPASNSMPEETTEVNAENTINNTAETNNINQAGEETTNQE